MTDTFDKATRSRVMSAIQSKDTQPEIMVRSALHGMGYRFRLHRKDLPGTPDIVLPRYKTVIFIHGCFWHSHKGCKYATVPKDNAEYWKPKLRKNKERDRRAKRELHKMGWRVLEIWECETRGGKEVIQERLLELFTTDAEAATATPHAS